MGIAPSNSALEPTSARRLIGLLSRLSRGPKRLSWKRWAAGDGVTFEETWRALATRQLALVAAVAAFVLLPMTVSLVRRDDEWTLPLAAALALIAVGVGVWHHQVRCPACNQFFFREVSPNGVPTGGQNPFTRKCVNCSCPIGATDWPQKPGTSAVSSAPPN